MCAESTHPAGIAEPQVHTLETGSVNLELAWTREFLRSAPRNRVIKRIGTLWDRCHDTHEACNLDMISHRLNMWIYTQVTRARGHNGTSGAPPTLRSAPAYLGATARPPPARPEPPRSRPPLKMTAISRHRDRAWTRELYRRPRGRRPAAPTAAQGVPRAPRTPPMLPPAVRPAPAARASVRRPLQPARPGRRPSTAGCIGAGGTRQRRHSAAEVCASAANKAR